MKPFQVSLKDAIAHGILVGVDLPGDGGPVPEHALARLHPSERRYAETLRAFRQASFVGGRLAAQAAISTLCDATDPVLPDEWGAPRGPKRLALSVSHKQDLAIALVARANHGSLGVDLEDLHPPRSSIAPRILRPEELEAVQTLSPDRHWTSTVVRFAVKEAIYKALAPHLRRYIDFQEASVLPYTDGRVDITLHLTEGPTPTTIEGRFIWLHERVVATVRAGWEAAATASDGGSDREADLRAQQDDGPASAAPALDGG